MDSAGLKKNHSVPESPKNPTGVSLTNLNGLNETRRLDTVGAIVLDSDGEIASAVSSGGILLKHPGRVGHASMFGCGCWVDEYQEQDEDAANENTNANIAAVTTGCGEYIIKTLLAKAICEHIVIPLRCILRVKLRLMCEHAGAQQVSKILHVEE